MSETITAKYESGVLVPQENLDLEEHQTVHLQIIPPQVNISAAQARRAVARFLLDNVSYLMGPERPALVQSDVLVWRVPVILTYPDQGGVGGVGYMDVDAEHGHVISNEQTVKDFKNRARSLSDSSAS